LPQQRFPLVAAHETIKARMEKPESDMTIEAILAGKGHEVATIAPDSTVTEAVAMLGEKRIGALPVMENGSVAGIFSERDVIYCLRDRYFNVGVNYKPIKELDLALVYKRDRAKNGFLSTSNGTIGGIDNLTSGSYDEFGLFGQFAF
jgi:hypothetical protein